MFKPNFIRKIFVILILSLIPCIGFMLIDNIYTVRADDMYTPKIIVEDKTVHRGQTFELDVSIADNEGLTSMLLILDYNRDVMKLKNILPGEALSTMTITLYNVDTVYGYGALPFNIMFDATSPDTSNGVFITLVFESFIDAPIGDYDVRFTYDTMNTRKEYLQPIDLDIDSGTVTLITGEFNAVYLDYDNTVLYEKDYNADDVPEFVGDNPVRDDDEYSYEFVEFTGIVSDDINTLKFMAVYSKTPKVYTIFYYIDGINMDYLDGKIDDNDYYTSQDCAFGEFVELVDIPFIQYYEFTGWYLDESFNEIYNYGNMPSHDLRLFGYYKYEIRETGIPIIELNVKEQTANVVKINADLIKNTGLNGMVLTLQYDHDVFELVGFRRGQEALTDLQFDHTNIEHMDSDNFKFYFEGSLNSYQTGTFLEMEFNIKDNIETDLYDITFTYEKTDATYYINDKDIEYTMLSIYKAKVPIGVIYEWRQVLGDLEFIVISDKGLPINVRMVVFSILDEINISKEFIDANVGRNMQLLSAYSIKLYQNNVEYVADTNFTIKIELNEKELQSSLLKLFSQRNEDNALSQKDFTTNGDTISFRTDCLNKYLIFGNYGAYKIIGSESKIVMLISFPILLAITTMFYAFLIKSKKKLNKEELNYDK